jgi:alpha-L-fucosidase
VGNNHHQTPFAGEDIQIFERDLPGENNAGLSGQEISRLPLETCETMNGMWGYKIIDQNYKTVPELIHLLVKAAGMGANLLLNIGPQPNGELPAAALNRLEGIGKWMDKYGETFYATTAGDFEAQEWGTSTRKGNKLYIHIFDNKRAEVQLPLSVKVKKAISFDSRESLKFKNNKQGGTTLYLPEIAAGTIDYIVELETTSKK